MSKKNKITSWLVTLIIIIVVFISFMLLNSFTYCNWLTDNIINPTLRVVFSGILQTILITVLIGVLLDYYIIEHDQCEQLLPNIN